MKQVITIVVVLFLTGCALVKSPFASKKSERKQKFSVTKNVVYYENKPFAELQAMTWSLDGGELVKEMNFKLLNKVDIKIIESMIDYLSDRHQGDEIEVEFNVEHNSEQFKL